jgi:hypothetical protein
VRRSHLPARLPGRRPSVTIWSQVLKHRARFEPTGWFEHRRRAQLVRWMWDLINESIQRLLQDKSEIREVSARVEAAVRSGVMTAGDGAENVLRALGLPNGALDLYDPGGFQARNNVGLRVDSCGARR